MPHKHTRTRVKDASTLDLPPNTIAQPLPVPKSANANGGMFTTELSLPKRVASKKRKRKDADLNDTPKAFLRLMAFQQGKKVPNGLDDGEPSPKTTKRKRTKSSPTSDVREREGPEAPVHSAGKSETPQIQAGERMSDFAARVDAALPVTGLIRKGKSKTAADPLGLKPSRTKTERKMHRMYAEWREQDKKRREKRDEELELAEELAEDDNGQVHWKADLIRPAGGVTNKKRKKKAKRAGKHGRSGALDDDDHAGDEDPWAVVKRNRGEDTEKKRDINDVVKAPPTFANVPRDRFRKVVDATVEVEVEHVPRASGSLRRREELGRVRKSIVDSYRERMKAS